MELFNKTLTPSIPDVHTELSCEFAKLATDSLISFFLQKTCNFLRQMGSFVVRGTFTHKLKNINTIGCFFLFIDFDDKCRKKHFPLRKVNTLNPNGINETISPHYTYYELISSQHKNDDILLNSQNVYSYHQYRSHKSQKMISDACIDIC